MNLQEQLRCNLAHWRAVGAPASVLNIIEHGARLPFTQQLPRFTSRTLKLETDEQRAAWAAIRTDYISNAAIRPVQPGDDVRCISPCFIIRKKERNKWRFIVDLRRVNRALRKLRCKYGHLLQLKRARNCSALVSFDLQDAYHHIGVHPQHQGYLAFSVEGEVFICTALPFGLTISPAIFMMVSRVLKTALLSGFDPDQPLQPLPPEPPWAVVVHYLDDFLVACRSEAAAKHFATRAVKLCIYLGFKLHFGKSTLDPTDCLVSLGLEVDVATGHFRVTAQRAARLAQQAKSLLLAAAQSARYLRKAALASFAGLAQSCTLAGPVYALHIRQIYTDMHADSNATYGKIRLSHQAMQSLRWFINVPKFFAESPIWQAAPPAGQQGQAGLQLVQQQRQQPAAAQPAPVLYTDASKTGWGGVFRAAGVQITMAGQWPVNLQAWPIHVLELEAVRMAVVALTPQLQGQRLLHVFTDNMAVMFFLRRWTTKDPASLQVLYSLSHLLGSLQLRLTASYVESLHNPADGPSRLWEPELLCSTGCHAGSAPRLDRVIPWWQHQDSPLAGQQQQQPPR